MIYPQMEIDEEDVEGLLVEAEVGSAVAGTVWYLGSTRMFISVLNLLPLPVIW